MFACPQCGKKYFSAVDVAEKLGRKTELQPRQRGIFYKIEKRPVYTDEDILILKNIEKFKLSACKIQFKQLQNCLDCGKRFYTLTDVQKFLNLAPSSASRYETDLKLGSKKIFVDEDFVHDENGNKIAMTPKPKVEDIDGNIHTALFEYKLDEQGNYWLKDRDTGAFFHAPKETYKQKMKVSSIVNKSRRVFE